MPETSKMKTIKHIFRRITTTLNRKHIKPKKNRYLKQTKEKKKTVGESTQLRSTKTKRMNNGKPRKSIYRRKKKEKENKPQKVE